MNVPVISSDGKPLMPTSPSRARRMVKAGEATPFFKIGVFCVRLNKIPSNNITQQIVIGIDPGSKKEAYTVKSSSYTYLNAQCDAITWVKDRVEERRNMRRGRRFRNTPCRKPRWANRGASTRSDRVPPSTKARYDLKISIVNKLASMFPISGIVVEDLKAVTKEGQKRWNKSFSPLQVGKDYFYKKLRNSFKLQLKSGFSTSIARKRLGLNKTKDKLSNQFDAHCVDSWVMANECVGGHSKPDNEAFIMLRPVQTVRRQLHKFQYEAGGVRPRAGGTRSLGFKKNSIIRFLGKTKAQMVRGDFYMVGGYDADKSRLSLSRIGFNYDKSDQRVNRSIRVEDCKFVSYNRFYTNV